MAIKLDERMDGHFSGWTRRWKGECLDELTDMNIGYLEVNYWMNSCSTGLKAPVMFVHQLEKLKGKVFVYSKQQRGTGTPRV